MLHFYRSMLIIWHWSGWTEIKISIIRKQSFVQPWSWYIQFLMTSPGKTHQIFRTVKAEKCENTMIAPLPANVYPSQPSNSIHSTQSSSSGSTRFRQPNGIDYFLSKDIRWLDNSPIVYLKSLITRKRVFWKMGNFQMDGWSSFNKSCSISFQYLLSLWLGIENSTSLYFSLFSKNGHLKLQKWEAKLFAVPRENAPYEWN